MLKDGAAGGNHSEVSRKEDSEQKGLRIQSGEKETAEHVQGRTRSWVLLKHEERQEWGKKIREIITTQAPDVVSSSPPVLASLPSLGSVPFFLPYCSSHSPSRPACVASAASLTRLPPSTTSLCKGLTHRRTHLCPEPWPHQLLTAADSTHFPGSISLLSFKWSSLLPSFPLVLLLVPKSLSTYCAVCYLRTLHVLHFFPTSDSYV